MSENILESVEGGPTWTLSEEAQKGLAYIAKVELGLCKLFRLNPKPPADVVEKFIQQGEGYHAAGSLSEKKIKLVEEFRDKQDEAVRFVAGIMGGY